MSTRILTALAFTLCVACPALAQVDTQGLPPELADDPWIGSLPREGIVVGDLEPKFGELGRAPKPGEEGSGTAAGASSGSGGTATTAVGARGASVGSSSDAGILSPAPVSAAESEPNDTFGTSQSVATSARVTGKIDPARDVDWYSFEAPRRGVIDITFSNLDPSLDIQFQIHDRENYNFTGWIRPKISGSSTETTTIDLAKAGRYFVVVGDKSGKAAAAGYQVTWQYHSGDRYEPNASFGHATPIEANTSIAVSVLPKRDVDWFTFEVERPGVANIQFTGVPDDLDIVFQVHDAENYNFTGWKSTKVRNGSTEMQVIDLAKAGRYYLVVADGKDDDRSIEPFTLVLSTDLADHHEPNGSLGRAVPIPATGSTEISLLPLKDSDWFAIPIDHPGQLEVTFENLPDSLGVSFQLHNEENYNFTGWITPKLERSGSETTVLDLATTGVYYLVVAESTGKKRSPESFRVKTRYTKGDAFEPNNSLGHAKKIGLGSAVRANILPKGDVDWFAVEVPREGTIEVVVSGIPDAMNPAIQIHTPENYNQTGWKVPKIRDGKAEAVEMEAKVAGLYYVIVANEGGKTRVPENYHLTVKLK